jgi:hypothetical protein
VDWKVDEKGTFSLYVLIPENTSAEIAVPGTDAKKISINGNSFDQVRGISFIHMKNGKVVFVAAPGEYQIESIQ